MGSLFVYTIPFLKMAKSIVAAHSRYFKNISHERTSHIEV